MDYHHRQPGTVIIVGLLVPLIVLVIVSLAVETFPPVLLPVAVIIAVSLALFYSLNVEITGSDLVCSFGIGLISKRIPLTDIREAYAVKNPWFVGWGIRWIPGQYWVWNVSGFQAVEAVLLNGSRFRIGTDEPEVLVQAIKMNKKA